MKLIKKSGSYELYHPKNCYDMNYHLMDTKNKVDYLIDIEDVSEYQGRTGYLSWGDLKTLANIRYIKTWAWKKKEL